MIRTVVLRETNVIPYYNAVRLVFFDASIFYFCERSFGNCLTNIRWNRAPLHVTYIFLIQGSRHFMQDVRACHAAHHCWVQRRQSRSSSDISCLHTFVRSAPPHPTHPSFTISGWLPYNFPVNNVHKSRFSTCKNRFKNCTMNKCTSYHTPIGGYLSPIPDYTQQLFFSLFCFSYNFLTNAQIQTLFWPINLSSPLISNNVFMIENTAKLNVLDG